MRWNPFREKKQSAVGFLHALLAGGSAVFAPRDYENFSKEGYQQNVILFRAIFEIAKAAATIPLILRNSTTLKETKKDHILLQRLRRPNPQQGGSTLFESHYSYKLIAGNAFMEAVRPQPTEPPREFYSLRPDRFEIQAGPKGFPSSYIYTAAGTRKVFKVDFVTGQSDILHDKSFHPTDDWWGLSPVEPGGMSIDQHNEAGKWNMKTLQNAAVPSGALELQSVRKKDGTESWPILTDQQFKNLSKKIDERMTGADNARRPVFFEGGLKWVQMALSHIDMDWSNGQDRAARNICHSVGFPPQLLGIPGDNTYSNYKEARLALYELTVLPFTSITVGELNNWMVPMFDPKLELAIDPDSIEALAPRRSEVWEKVQQANWLTVNEKREATGYDLIGDEGNVILVPVGMVPLESIDIDTGDGGDDDEGDGDDDDGDEE